MTDQELSCFFVRELFPLKTESGSGLDTHRIQKIETLLAACKKCRDYYSKLEKARATVIDLAGTKPSPAMISYLKEEHHFWKDTLAAWGWKRWPSTLKWAVELSVTTTVLILTVHYFPWLRLARTVQNMRPAAPVVVTAQTPEPAPVKIQTSETPGPEVQAQMQAQPTESPGLIAKVTPISKEEASDAETTAKEEENPQTAGVVAKESEQKMLGFVWRGSLKVDELNDEVADHVSKVIRDLGGTKAGQVELGWRRGKQRYYHFILPEDNYEKFLSVLNELGIVQLTQERHQRTIRPGHMRIIMTVEESEE